MSEKHGDVDLGVLIGRLEELFAGIYPEARDVEVKVEGVDFAKGLSDPYLDDSGGVPHVVAAFKDRMNFRLRIIIDHKKGGNNEL